MSPVDKLPSFNLKIRVIAIPVFVMSLYLPVRTSTAHINL
jgi:hypothetical protein